MMSLAFRYFIHFMRALPHSLRVCLCQAKDYHALEQLPYPSLQVLSCCVCELDVRSVKLMSVRQ